MDLFSRGLLGLKRRHLFTLYLLLGSVLIVVGITSYTLRISRELEAQNRLITELFSGMASRLLFAGESPEAERVMRIINEIGIPLVITDAAGRPFLWNASVTGIPEVDDFELLMRQDPQAPDDPRVAAALALAAKFDRNAQPFALLDAAGRRLGTLHYGQSALSKQIRIMPYLELAIMVLFFLAILWGLQVKKENDQNLLFAGMAKESAHQMGTPLTSIMGWLAILQQQQPDDDTLAELGKDVDRLNKVSARFSQIGSRPKLEDTDLAARRRGYGRLLPPPLAAPGRPRRAAHRGRRQQPGALQPRADGVGAREPDQERHRRPRGGQGHHLAPPGGPAGRRRHDPRRGHRHGHPAGHRGKIFDPGFSTKSRGWGMGLALVKRIVTQYHGGRIRIESTGPQGTVFAISLPGKD
jgi:signal transduction histidine kinase